MSDKNKSSGRGFGCLGMLLLLLTLATGPIDSCRTVYNFMLGDIPIIKNQILNYSRVQIQEQYPNLDSELVEETLASRLQLSIGKGDEISSDMVSIFELWSLVEVYPRSWKDRWIWASLK